MKKINCTKCAKAVDSYFDAECFDFGGIKCFDCRGSEREIWSAFIGEISKPSGLSMAFASQDVTDHLAKMRINYGD